jgi:hypothetical protein
VNAILTQVAEQRYDVFKRKFAENAYQRQSKYNGENQKKLSELEALLTGKKEFENMEETRKQFQQLGAGQVKQVAIPVGKTLEETIDLWRNVRSEAISVPEPTSADYQLAAKATSKIHQTEAQITLHDQAKSEIKMAVTEDDAEAVEVAFMDLPSEIDRELMKMKKRYEHAISTYSFHVQMKQRGFNIDFPSFYKIA